MNQGQQKLLNDYLAQLVLLGYGRTRGEVKDYLIQRALDDLVRVGIVRAAT